jgi:hypothetical protein
LLGLLLSLARSLLELSTLPQNLFLAVLFSIGARSRQHTALDLQLLLLLLSALIAVHALLLVMQIGFGCGAFACCGFVL